MGWDVWPIPFETIQDQPIPRPTRPVSGATQPGCLSSKQKKERERNAAHVLFHFGLVREGRGEERRQRPRKRKGERGGEIKRKGACPHNNVVISMGVNGNASTIFPSLTSLDLKSISLSIQILIQDKKVKNKKLNKQKKINNNKLFSQCNLRILDPLKSQDVAS